jgi:two-component system OmpR family response regulator
MKGRLLVIDDEKAFCSFLRCLFNQDGYAVETSPNGKNGLERARAEKFDAIITDIIMPGLNGVEVIARLRADGNEIPIIAITGYTPRETMFNTAQYHYLDFILYKPFSAEAIRDIVETALAASGRIEKFQEEADESFFPFNNRGL